MCEFMWNLSVFPLFKQKQNHDTNISKSKSQIMWKLLLRPSFWKAVYKHGFDSQWTLTRSKAEATEWWQRFRLCSLRGPGGKGRGERNPPLLLCILGPPRLGLSGPWAGTVKDPLPAIPHVGRVCPTRTPRPGWKPRLAPAHPESGGSQGQSYRTGCEWGSPTAIWSQRTEKKDHHMNAGEPWTRGQAPPFSSHVFSGNTLNLSEPQFLLL